MCKLRDVKFACHMADLAVTYELAVDPKIETGVNALKVEEKITVHRIFVKLKITQINSARIVVRHIGRIAGVGVTLICIVRHIVTLVKIHLPVHRHLDFVIISVKLIVLGVEAVLNVNYRLVKSEIPFAVEKLKIFRLLSRLCQSVFLIEEGNEI